MMPASFRDRLRFSFAGASTVWRDINAIDSSQIENRSRRRHETIRRTRKFDLRYRQIIGKCAIHLSVTTCCHGMTT
jgi:hypothetical protein